MVCDEPLVSVVIPCYRQAQFVRQAAESVLSQEYRHREVIVVDDGSPDDVAGAVAGLEVRVLRQENRGQPAARNRGLDEARGEFVVFLDADDRLLPGALAIGVAELMARPDVAFVYGQYRLIDARGEVIRPARVECVEGEHYVRLLRENFIATPGIVMFRRLRVVESGGFNTSLRASEDYELYLRICRLYPIACHAGVIAERRIHETNLTANVLRTLPSAFAARRAHWPLVKGDVCNERVYREGLRAWSRKYGFGLGYVAWRHAKVGEWALAGQAVRAMITEPRFLWFAIVKGVDTLRRCRDRH